MTIRAGGSKISRMLCESYKVGYLPERWECSIINNGRKRHYGSYGTAPHTRGFSSSPRLMMEWLDSPWPTLGCNSAGRCVETWG